MVVHFQPPKSEGKVPAGFKKVDLPVVRFDSIRAVGQADDKIEDKEIDAKISVSMVVKQDHFFCIGCQ